MRIASNIIDSIKAKADIVEVIGEYVHLTQKGQNYIGLCPFHSDSTPSLTVSPSKGIYKCFACDASGDVINFLQEHLKISFVEAVKMLANKYGIEIPDDSCSMADDADQRKRESMLIINDYAAKYFAENLLTKQRSQTKLWLMPAVVDQRSISVRLVSVMPVIVGTHFLCGLRERGLIKTFFLN